MKCGRPLHGQLFLTLLGLNSLLLRGEDLTKLLKRKNVRQWSSGAH
jgi:hypothetical protein